MTSAPRPPAGPSSAPSAAAAAVAQVAAIMERLRAEDGCAWTRSQTLETLWPYLIEEAHEAAHAARLQDYAELKEELGDVLLQVVYQSAIAQEAGQFTLQDVAQTLSAKLIRRHPHVFARVQAASADDVSRRWEEIKAEERAERARDGRPPKGRLSGLPATLPALIYAQRATDKAASAGFDWPNHLGAAAKVREELAEVLQAAELAQQSNVSQAQRHALEEELGDLMLSVVNLCRLLQVQAEGALLGAVAKFRRRFAHVEAGMHHGGVDAANTLDHLQRLWDEAKALKL